MVLCRVKMNKEERKKKVLDMIVYSEEPLKLPVVHNNNYRPPFFVAEHKELGIKIVLNTDNPSKTYRRNFAKTLIELAIDEICKF